MRSEDRQYWEERRRREEALERSDAQRLAEEERDQLQAQLDALGQGAIAREQALVGVQELFAELLAHYAELDPTGAAAFRQDAYWMPDPARQECCATCGRPGAPQCEVCALDEER